MLSKEQVEYKYEQVAQEIMFGSKDTKEKLKYISDMGMEFRKGKGVSDINNALKLSIKNGRGDTEFELGMLEIYLKRVFKIKR